MAAPPADPPSAITSRLLEWYEGNRRDLPWRGRTDPYEIWVSEIMLQQTRSETVLRYYQRFLDRFPTVEALAEATEDEVLAAWSGLGYYRRARQLHRAARQVASRGCRVPSEVGELLELPGVGTYTAAAIASLAFGVPVTVLDGNVERVLTRFRAVEEDPRKAAGRRILNGLAQGLLDPDRAGDFNQAMMELGARVCTPRNPGCDVCPLAPDCAARAEGTQELFPVTAPRPEMTREEWVAVLARDGDAVLLVQRSRSDRLLAGMWELPSVLRADDVEAELSALYGGEWSLEAECARVRHSITSRALSISVRPGRWDPAGVAEETTLAWIREGELADTPTTSIVEKVLAAAGSRAQESGAEESET